MNKLDQSLNKTSLDYSRVPKTLYKIVEGKTMLDNYETEVNYVTTYESKSPLWDLTIPFIGGDLSEIFTSPLEYNVESRILMVIKHWKDSNKTTVVCYNYCFDKSNYQSKKTRLLCIKPKSIYYFRGKSIRRISDKWYNSHIGEFWSDNLNEELGLKNTELKVSDAIRKYCSGVYFPYNKLDRSIIDMEEAVCKYLEIPSVILYENDIRKNAQRIELLLSFRNIFNVYDYRKILKTLEEDRLNSDNFGDCSSMHHFLSKYYLDYFTSIFYNHNYIYKLKLGNTKEEFLENVEKNIIKTTSKNNKRKFKNFRYTTDKYKRLLQKLFIKSSNLDFKVLNKQEVFDYHQDNNKNLYCHKTFYLLINNKILFSVLDPDFENCKENINFDIYFEILKKINKVSSNDYSVFTVIDKIKKHFPTIAIPEYFNNITNNLPF